MCQGIEVVANASGLNPQGCADALRVLAGGLYLTLRIATVLVD